VRGVRLSEGDTLVALTLAVPDSEVLVVTDDSAERDTVSGMGGSVASCANFIRMIESALTELQDDLRNYNRTERNRFKRPQ